MTPSTHRWTARRSPCLVLTVAVLCSTSPAAAQDNALVEAVAPLLAVEDAREWAPATLESGIQHP
ncbi:MAG: hypothetical protein E4H37_06935, partial [Gemmatimonadales bacterium]